MTGATGLRSCLLGVLAALVGVWSACGQVIAGDVAGPARIMDGDTLAIGDTIIRLHGVDAAEAGQRCNSAGRRIAHPGKDAATFLKSLTAEGISCSGSEVDDYGRLIAICHTPAGEDINRRLVAEGWAWAFVKYSSDYLEDERSARSKGLGVWALACEPPWEYRHKRWEVEAQKAPEGCPIKGNISRNGRIYHVPWGRDYLKTRIDTSKGERWFCNEKEALAAGWRPPNY